jgi:hypothetical protein
MKTLQGMKTRFAGDYIVPVLACAFSAAIGLSGGVLLEKAETNNLVEHNFTIPKDRWHCFAGVLDDNSNFECMIYRRKDTDFGKHSSPRRGNHDKEQRSSVYPIQ